MLPVRIAVISDLHIGKGARSEDLCPLKDGNFVENNYKDKFISFLRKEIVNIDYVVIPGDISHSAHPDEIALASNLIQELTMEFKLPLNRIMYVPGNHDVDWTILRDKDSSGFRFSQRYATLKNKDWIFQNIIEQGEYTLLEHPYFAAWDHDDAFFLGYNSSATDKPEETIHHGLVIHDCLIQMEEYLKNKIIPQDKLKIFIVHHHPFAYSDPLPETKDYSIMINTENLLTLLNKYQFDLVIHGHKHNPHFTTHIIQNSFPIALLCAGSFSAILDTLWSGLVNNQFHIVQIDGRNKIDGTIYGTVFSWTYLYAYGWQKSQINNGIRHKIPFGTHVLPHVLVSKLMPIVIEQFKKSDYLEWNSLFQIVPELRNMGPESVLEVINLLSKKIKFRKHGEPPDEIILLKEY